MEKRRRERYGNQEEDGKALGQNSRQVTTSDLDESLPDADGPAAPKGSLVLVAVVAHGAVLQHHVAVLPPMDIVGPF